MIVYVSSVFLNFCHHEMHDTWHSHVYHMPWALTMLPVLSPAWGMLNANEHEWVQDTSNIKEVAFFSKLNLPVFHNKGAEIYSVKIHN